MILIGERINAGFKDVKQAILSKDGNVIKEWARKQTAAKADYLEVNLGTASNKPEDLCWMIEMVQAAVDTPISIDNQKPEMLKAALPICKRPALVNSTTAADEKLDGILPLVAKYGASVIGVVMDESGSPTSADKRVENGGKIMAKAMEHDISPERVFLDPIAMPIKYKQDQTAAILSAVSQFKLFSDPPCHIVCGLSNTSNGTTQKKLINRIYCSMMISHGLDSVILDVMDEDLVNSILTAELIMNRSIYADSFIEAFRKG